MKFENLRIFAGILFLAINPFFYSIQAQDAGSQGQINGNFQIGGQYYQEDDRIGAVVPDQDVGFNSFANLIYTHGNFSAGVRFESYEPSLVGYPASPVTSYSGSGVGYRYASYTTDDIGITVGNFYEQFGNGLIFRAYEERGLGVDNSVDGIRVKYNAMKGVRMTGIYGRQRIGFDNGFTKGDGIVRGGDIEFNLNDMLDSSFAESKMRIRFGGSFISKYQEDADPEYVLPENVSAFAGRANLNYGGLAVTTEFAQKINDPSSDNNFIYKNGNAFLFTTSYSQKGFGVVLGAQFIDNMSYRSDRYAGFTDLQINFLPPVAKQHTYNLAATLYPYATQLNGEIGAQGEVFYKFKKDTPLGGKYGTTLTVNYSVVNNLDTTHLNDLGDFEERQGYEVDYFSFSGKKYFRDLNVEITKKWSKKIKTTFMYINFYFDIATIQGKLGDPDVKSHIGITDLTYKISKKHSIRTELQYLQTEQHLGSWATGLVEYTFSPHWFFAVQDQYNAGNKNVDDRVHYITGSFGYSKGPTRIIVIGGKQRAGLFCVGGVCRVVPASNGVSLTITSTF